MSEKRCVFPDPRGLSHAQRLEQLARIQRERARLDAAQARLLAAIDPDPLADSDADGNLDKHWDREEAALILRVCSGTVKAMTVQAVDLVTRFPAALALLEAGTITAGMCRRLVEACVPLADQLAAQVQARVLQRAGELSLSQFGAALRRAVATLAPTSSEQAHAAAREQRGVSFTHRPDGTSDLWAPGLHGADALAMQNALRTLATTWKEQDPADERSGEQRHADALVALVLGQPEASAGVSLRPAINVTVAASTLLDHDQQPGELDGHGPIPAPIARALATDPTGTWRRLLTDTQHQLIDVSARTYRPPANMARFVRALHPRCCFPGCRHRAASCELDHVLDWAHGGATSPSNLQPLCSRHHHAKHDAGWNVHRQADGTTVWTSPTGNTYTRPPDELPIDTSSDPPGNEAA